MAVRKRIWTTKSGERRKRGSLTTTRMASAISRRSSARKMPTPAQQIGVEIFAPVHTRQYPSRSPWPRRPRTGSRAVALRGAKPGRWHNTGSTHTTSASGSARSGWRASRPQGVNAFRDEAAGEHVARDGPQGLAVRSIAAPGRAAARQRCPECGARRSSGSMPTSAARTSSRLACTIPTTEEIRAIVAAAGPAGGRAAHRNLHRAALLRAARAALGGR